MDANIRNVGLVISGCLINVMLGMLAVMKGSEAGLWLLVVSSFAGYVANYFFVLEAIAQGQGSSVDELRANWKATVAGLACCVLTVLAAVNIAFA